MLRLDCLLVVAEPLVSLLVDGEKTWELRTTSTKIRGRIGIAAKGTGTVIGAVDLVDVHKRFLQDRDGDAYRPCGGSSRYGHTTMASCA